MRTVDDVDGIQRTGPSVTTGAGVVPIPRGLDSWYWSAAKAASATTTATEADPPTYDRINSVSEHVKRKPRKKYAVAQALNTMRRAIHEIIDPGPTSIAALWEHFDSRCAYCDVVLVRGARDAHTDHAEPDGGNHIGNLVLSCGQCNGDEKRDEPWRDFLRRKSADGETFEHRERRILDWFELHPRPEKEPSAEVEEQRLRCEALVDEFGVACKELKAMVRIRDA